MGIKTDGKHEYRLDQLRRIMQATEEGTKSGAFDFSTEFTLRILDNLDQAIHHPDVTEELAEVFSTPTVDLTYRIEADFDVNPSQQARTDE